MMNIFKISTVWLCSCIVLGLPVAAQAQSSTPATSLDELQSKQRLKPGESVQIFDNNGSRLKARFGEVSSNGITVTVNGQRRELQLSDVKEIRHRRPERWWDGMVIGMVVGGVIAGVAVAADGGDGYLPPAAFIALGAAEFGGIGALIDLAIKKDETVFVRPGTSSNRGLKISPMLSKEQAGVRMAWSF